MVRCQTGVPVAASRAASVFAADSVYTTVLVSLRRPHVLRDERRGQHGVPRLDFDRDLFVDLRLPLEPEPADVLLGQSRSRRGSSLCAPGLRPRSAIRAPRALRLQHEHLSRDADNTMRRRARGTLFAQNFHEYIACPSVARSIAAAPIKCQHFTTQVL